jgi:3-oxoacyl-[acyl-carrier protein] reductase
LNLDLAGKIALITGSSRGIGRGIAQTLHEEGCLVILNGRDADTLSQSAQPLGGNYVVGDVCIPDQARKVVDTALKLKGKLDIVVANVGSGDSTPLGAESSEEWSRMLNLNIESAVNTISASREALAASKGAALCVSSICGLSVLGAPIAYSAAKAALNSYVRGISVVLALDGVRIVGLAPGNVLFPGSTWDHKLKVDEKAVQRMLEANVPMRRLGSVSEIANVAAFLCSPKASFMTGTVVTVDGGQIKI